MGVFGRLVGGMLGGANVAGAHNAFLAERTIEILKDVEKTLVAEQVVEMGVRSYRGSITPERFCKSFNRSSRICQLNLIALALASMDIHILPECTWMEIKNPFALNVDAKTLEMYGMFLKKKYNFIISIKSGSLDIFDWLKPTKINDSNNNVVHSPVQKNGGAVTIKTSPSGFRVAINETYVPGTTPLTAYLVAGKNLVQIYSGSTFVHGDYVVYEGQAELVFNLAEEIPKEEKLDLICLKCLKEFQSIRKYCVPCGSSEFVAGR